MMRIILATSSDFHCSRLCPDLIESFTFMSKVETPFLLLKELLYHFYIVPVIIKMILIEYVIFVPILLRKVDAFAARAIVCVCISIFGCQ